jgi:hypothetical protein
MSYRFTESPPEVPKLLRKGIVTRGEISSGG